MALALNAVIVCPPILGACASRKVGLAQGPKPGWFYVVDYEPEHVPLLEGVPGVRFTPESVWVSCGLAAARPDLFDVVYPDPATADAPSVTARALGEIPTEIVRLGDRAVTRVRDYQRVGAAHLRQPVGAVLSDDLGCGKQQPIDTKVLTPWGWRAVGALQVGDSVIGSDGRAVAVTGVFPQGVKPSYRVWLSDGSSVEAGPEHLWCISYWCGGRRRRELTLTTEQLRMRPTIECRHETGRTTCLDLANVRLFVPTLAAPVHFADPTAQHPPIPPYTLGALLANGCLGHGSPSIVVNTLDKDEVVQALRAEGSDVGRIAVYGSATHIGLRGVVESIRALGIALRSREKFVPDVYLRAAPADRVALLQGLLDGDGSCSRDRNRVTYHTTSRALAEGVQELVEGLGGTARLTVCDRSDEGKPTEYPVRLRLPSWVPPFRVERKRARYSPGFHALPSRSVERVEYVRDVESVCIRVAAEDRLYATEHCILTHNTTQAVLAAKASGYQRVLVTGSLIARSAWCGPRGTPMRHFGFDVEPLEGIKQVDLTRPGAGWFYCHYDILDAWFPWITARFRPELVIFDEAHWLRNPRARRSRKAFSLARLASVQSRYVLTGTPVTRSRADLYSLLDCAQPDAWGENFHQFGLWFMAGYKGEFGFIYDGESHSEEFRDRLARAMLRRERDDVQAELPPIDRQVIDVQLDPEALEEYRRAEKSIRAYLRAYLDDAAAQVSGDRLVQITKLCSILSRAKVPTAIELAKQAIISSGKLVVFTWYKQTATKIAEAIKNDPELDAAVFGPTTGETPAQARIERAARFREHDGRAVFVATLGSASESLNDLIGAHVVQFVDLYWDPLPVLQGEGRLRRDGQTQSVLSQFLRAVGTIEDRMLEVIETKAAEIKAGRGGQGATDLVGKLAGRRNERSALDELCDALLSLDPDEFPTEDD